MKKILMSVLAIGVVGAAVAYGTGAFFSDTETSLDNTFTTGAIDLKIDHTRQVYNGVDCHTCSVLLTSDITNVVVAKNGVAVTPYNAVLAWVHPAWTSQNDPSLLAANAKWIWEANPTKQEDTTTDVTYTFRKEFEWLGPITGSDLTMAVGHDNTVEVWLNGFMVGSSTDIYGFQIEHMLHIPAANLTSHIIQGNNVLEFILHNRGQADGNPTNNPAGLIYKFEINGNCGDEFFISQCKLWQSKDLVAGDVFYNFDDIKPGDSGLNVISLLVSDNDAYACLNPSITSSTDVPLVEPEVQFPDVTPLGDIELQTYFFAWLDDGNGIFDLGETTLTAVPQMGSIFLSTPLPLFTPPAFIPALTTKYVAIAWCAGLMTQPVAGSPIVCDGNGMNNAAQADQLMTTLSFYAEQVRNNPNFSCDSL